MPIHIRIPRSLIRDSSGVTLLIACAIARSSAVSICVPNFSRLVFALFIGVSLFFARKDRGRLSKAVIKANPHTLIFIALIIPSIIVNCRNSSVVPSLLLICAVLIAYLITAHSTKEKLIERYLQTMFFLCVFSLICFLLFTVLSLPTDWMLHLTKQSDGREKFRSIVIYSIRLKDAERNCGPFWEPSIFAAYIAFAIVFQLFFSNHFSKKRLLVFVLTLASTMSSGGVLMLLLIALLWIWRNRKGSTIVTLFTLILAGVAVFFWDGITDALLSLDHDLFSKIILFRDSRSAMSRVFSVLIDLEIWRRSPLFGVGLAQVDALYHSTKMSDLALSLYQMTPSQSATPLIIVAGFGVFGAYYSYLWVKACSETQNFSNIQKALLGLLVFFVLTETPHTHFILTYYILCTLLHKEAV